MCQKTYAAGCVNVMNPWQPPCKFWGKIWVGLDLLTWYSWLLHENLQIIHYNTWFTSVLWCQFKDDLLCRLDNRCLLATGGSICGHWTASGKQRYQWQTGLTMAACSLGSLSQPHWGLCLCTQFIHHYQTTHRFRCRIHFHRELNLCQLVVTSSS